MNAYLADRAPSKGRGITELGECSEDDVPRLLEKVRDLEEGGGSVAAGFCRSEEDFVEIDYVGKGGFLVHSDRLYSPKSFWSFLGAKPGLSKTITGLDGAVQFVRAYFNKDRQEFEELFD